MEAARKVGELVARFHSEVADVVGNDSGEKQNVQIILLHSFASNLNRPECGPIDFKDENPEPVEAVRLPSDQPSTQKST